MKLARPALIIIALIVSSVFAYGFLFLPGTTSSQSPGLFIPAEASSAKGGSSNSGSSSNPNAGGQGHNNQTSSNNNLGNSQQNSNNNSNNGNGNGGNNQNNSQNPQGSGSNSGNSNTGNGNGNGNSDSGNNGGNSQSNGGLNQGSNQQPSGNGNGNNGSGGGSGNGNNNSNNENNVNDNSVVNPFNGKARAIQDGLSIDTSTDGNLASPIDCYGGVESVSGADSATCYLVPDGVPSPKYKTDPSVISQPMTEAPCPSGAGFTSGDKCFSTTFGQNLFSPGHWRFVVEFYKGSTQVDLAGIDYRVHSFFVLPESPVGVAALMGSSLAALGAFVVYKKRKTPTV